MGRKGYKDIKKQIEANERYLKGNEEAQLKKKITSLRSNGKNYIKNYADLLGLEELETLIKERKKELELQE
ncbi:hypothetical protein [Fusobacterium polymorphum]|uniref:hypothetical protein n=1 Tax=Fusobacterium nucleatum subsp. polymorphum TaxID=76857 RepID=UPI0030095784